MALEDDKAIREQLISEGYKAKQIDDIHKHIGCSYAQIKKMGYTISRFYQPRK